MRPLQASGGASGPRVPITTSRSVACGLALNVSSSRSKSAGSRGRSRFQRGAIGEPGGRRAAGRLRELLFDAEAGEARFDAAQNIDKAGGCRRGQVRQQRLRPGGERRRLWLRCRPRWMRCGPDIDDRAGVGYGE